MRVYAVSSPLGQVRQVEGEVMQKDYRIEDGCHNCGRRASQLDIVIPKDKDILCGHEPEREEKLVRGRREHIVRFAVVHPAGKCGAWIGRA